MSEHSATESPETDPLADFSPNEPGLTRALQTLIERRGNPGEPHPRESAMPAAWPALGVGGLASLQSLTELALDRPARLDHRGFLAHMDPPTPWFTWAAAQWAAATNQNLLHADVAPQMRRLEEVVIEWIAPSFAMSGGHLVPGSTVANLTALWAARDLRGATEVVSSAAAHLSVAKAAHILGLTHRTVPTRADQTIDIEMLGDVRSAVVVLTAGTTGSGAVDDLALADRSVSGASWVHVDAAWAGPLRFSPSHAGVIDGIEQADSIAFSAHKWLHQPKENAAVLFADADEAHAALSFGGGYLSAPNVGLLGSAGARALPLAVTLLAWGRIGVAAVIDAGVSRIDELHRLVDAHADFELFSSPTSGVLLWRPVQTNTDLVHVQQQLRDAWVSIAEVEETQWFRSVGANPLAEPTHVFRAVQQALHTARGG